MAALPHLHITATSSSLLLPLFSRLPMTTSLLSRPRIPTLFKPLTLITPAAATRRRGFSSQPKFADEDDQLASAADLRFESPLQIIKYPDPILRAPNKRISTFDDNLKKLALEMFDIMYKTDGLGLSAPQVGVNVQLMVFNPAGVKGEGEEIVLVNPVVYKVSKRTTFYEEGCLSFPGIYAEVERPATVKIDARDLTGAKFKMNLSGFSARVFQHEFDHLEGVLFFDRMTEDVLESIRQQLKNLEKEYEDKTGQPSPENVDNYKGIKMVAGFGGR